MRSEQSVIAGLAKQSIVEQRGKLRSGQLPIFLPQLGLRSQYVCQPK